MTDTFPQEIHVTRSGTENTNTTQSGDCIRVSGVSPQNSPATRIWYGEVRNAPGHRSLPHHHGECETGGRVIAGHGRIYFGEDYSDYVDLHEGDWVFVPPGLPHVEANMSTVEELIWMTTRTPENIVVNLPDVDDSTLHGYERA